MNGKLNLMPQVRLVGRRAVRGRLGPHCIDETQVSFLNALRNSRRCPAPGGVDNYFLRPNRRISPVETLQEPHLLRPALACLLNAGALA